jgi:hypothetical protein
MTTYFPKESFKEYLSFEVDESVKFGALLLIFNIIL